MIALGFDPGLDGAVSFIDADGGCDIADLPTVKLPGSGMVHRELDGKQLADLLRARLPAGVPVTAYIEEQRAMGGKDNALQTQGSVMHTYGVIKGVLGAMGIRFRIVTPHQWKSLYGIGSDKKVSMSTALRLYPDAPLTLAKHHNRAESLLVAHYGMRTSG